MVVCVELAALASSGLTETVQTGGWSDTQPESWVTVAAAAVTLQQVCSSFSRKWFIWGGAKEHHGVHINTRLSGEVRRNSNSHIVENNNNLELMFRIDQ